MSVYKNHPGYHLFPFWKSLLCFFLGFDIKCKRSPPRRWSDLLSVPSVEKVLCSEVGNVNNGLLPKSCEI